MPSVSREKLLALLSNLPAGPVTDVGKLPHLLADVWDDLSNSDEEAMRDYKIFRMENVLWEPPVLSFLIERHGITAVGSSRASLHHWEVNTVDWQAHLVDTNRFRQLEKPAASYTAIDATQDATLIANILLSSQDDPRIERTLNGKLKVNIRLVVPGSGNKETDTKRNKRFREALGKILKPLGWEESPSNHWRPPHTHNSP